MKRQVVIVRRSEESGSRGRSRSSSVRYGECQKNHAANAGGYAVDGCREFMAGGDQGTGDALACAACGCHRNFHKKLLDTTDESS